MDIEHRIEGVPCIIRVTHYEPKVPEHRHGHPDIWAPGEPAEVEYEVLDSKGYRAEWLERKITAEMDDSIRAMLIEKLEKLEKLEHEYE